MYTNRYSLLFIATLIGICSRTLPHIPNVTALTSLSILLGMHFSKRTTLTILLMTLVSSDLALAYYFGYSAFGSWTFFTYTGFMMIGLIANQFAPHEPSLRLMLHVLGSSIGFWIWTNFGVWLLSGLYSTDKTGLIACYTTALPFLRNGLLGDMLWMTILLMPQTSKSSYILKQ